MLLLSLKKWPKTKAIKSVTPKLAACGGARFRVWATQLRRNDAAAASRWRNAVSDLTDPGIKPLHPALSATSPIANQLVNLILGQLNHAISNWHFITFCSACDEVPS